MCLGGAGNAGVGVGREGFFEVLPSVVFPDLVCIVKPRPQFIHNVLVCILFVFEVRLFVLKTPILGFTFQCMINTDKVQTEASSQALESNYRNRDSSS